MMFFLLPIFSVTKMPKTRLKISPRGINSGLRIREKQVKEQPVQHRQSG